MKAEVMVRALPKDVTKVYLINQDYLFGQSVQRDVKTFLAKPAGRAGGRRRADPARQDQGLFAVITEIKASGRAGAADRQLGAGHEPA
jgi:branched-chain amino acid transport system substrate-binding protein